MSFLQLGYSALAALGLLGLAMIMAISGMTDLISHGWASVRAANSFQWAYSLGLIGSLCLPSAWVSAQRLITKNDPGSQPSVSNAWKNFFPHTRKPDAFVVLTILSVVVMPAVLILGHLAAKSEQLAWLVLPPLNLLVTGLPVLWLVMLGLRKLNSGSNQLKWGGLAVALVAGPILILVTELVMIVLAGGLALGYLSTQPGQLEGIFNIIKQLRSMGPPNQEALLSMVEPYLEMPWVRTGLLVLAALVVPMIEELLKPVGVWLIAWKKLTPAEGLALGILSGAGFALFENLGNISGAGEMWAVVAASRVPAALLHMLTSGMMGWAIATAWTERRYLRLVLVYGLAVIIHGLWNGLAVIGTFTIPLDQPLQATPELTTSAMLIVAGLVALLTVNFSLYLRMNRRMRAKAQPVEMLNN